MLRTPQLVLAAVVVAALGAWAALAFVAEPIGGVPMSDAAMKLCVSDWYAEHPAHGGVSPAAATALAVDTFLVTNFRFDSDGRSATQIDTVRVNAGEFVMWKIASGFHTTTSGKPTDLDAGSLWDLPVDPGSPEVVVDFPTPGTYPFFCRPHGAAFNMRGVVVVTGGTAGVGGSPRAAGAGFSRPAWPNPSRQNANFRFRVDRSGEVSLRILDASGRAVAHVLGGTFAAGEHDAAWNLRDAGGRRASPGTYWALLDVHGVRSSTKVVVAR
ncbi:MAG: hypothetical protein HZA61_03050 [Candidatus Eisenbacteria bacterium]|uniref:Blue (type 1) copper domain-containing protein n=1 Tax=Eiseniibacteriota bacterium TaxID=2212470 RepID=A0A933SEC9_UNCEI|nr:hypothetical protein [Candidatus Eisenbacteria bacterium]